MDLLKTQLGRTRIIAFVEGISFLVLLFITMPLKYMCGMPTPNKIFGMVHGGLFILYVLAVIQSKIEYNWNFKKNNFSITSLYRSFRYFLGGRKIVSKVICNLVL